MWVRFWLTFLCQIFSGHEDFIKLVRAFLGANRGMTGLGNSDLPNILILSTELAEVIGGLEAVLHEHDIEWHGLQGLHALVVDVCAELDELVTGHRQHLGGNLQACNLLSLLVLLQQKTTQTRTDVDSSETRWSMNDSSRQLLKRGLMLIVLKRDDQWMIPAENYSNEDRCW